MAETLSIAGIIVQVIGTSLIAYMALTVHDRVRKEHKIDDKVFSEMRSERVYGILGVVLVIFGAAVHIIGIILKV